MSKIDRYSDFVILTANGTVHNSKSFEIVKQNKKKNLKMNNYGMIALL